MKYYQSTCDAATTVYPQEATVSIAILLVDPAIGSQEALRRLRKRFNGICNDIGATSEAFTACIDFNPAKHSAVQFAQLNGWGSWAKTLSFFLTLHLVSAEMCSACEWCGSRDRYAVLRKCGAVAGRLCDQCGHFDGGDSQLNAARWWPDRPPTFQPRAKSRQSTRGVPR